ncbi:MAG: hypothetical protein ACI9U2_001402 [Bradymonadia bacterium]|jgi:hypothetical protein
MELDPSANGITLFRLLDGGALFAALVPVENATISGVSSDTDYWLGDHPDSWPSTFSVDKITRATPKSAAALETYTAGSITVDKWYTRALQDFSGSSGSYAWSSSLVRIWKATVPATSDLLYVVWTGTDFAWVASSVTTPDYVDLTGSQTLDFSETSGTITGVLAIDV